VDGVQAQPADLDHFLIVEEHVVAAVFEPGSVGSGDRYFVAGLPHCCDGPDVVVMAVGFENAPNAEAFGEFEELFMLVRGVDQDRFARLGAAHHEHVVVVRAYDHLVDFDPGCRPVERHGYQCATGRTGRISRMGRTVAPTITIPLNDLRRGLIADRAILLEAVTRVIDSGWSILRDEVAAFEVAFAEYVGAAGAVGVANGTDALELSLRAVGVGAGDEVITVANAGGYSSVAILALGAVPVFVDVDRQTLNIDPTLIGAALGPRTKAVVVTHLYGLAAPVSAIVRSLDGTGVAVVEDCAQAHGTLDEGRRVGAIGDVGAFSMYPTKNLGAVGDAGLIVSRRVDVVERARKLRTYGWGDKYRMDLPGGRNSRLDEMQAAILRARFPMLETHNKRRREIAQHYRSAAPSLDWVGMMDDAHTGHLCAFRHIDRDHARSILGSLGVGSDVHYPIPDHKQPALKSLAFRVVGDLARTDAACDEVLSVPNFPELTDAEVADVAIALAKI
jgi:dTDP-3-amino-2,3,6-trideoxy-4-keto-D-glucose/dTDP-3-amino-3,4,6-trideoxy-alpha-D-glucose/dTDP-2,6-dideoxy-D-kanosamine transaminase